MDAKTETAREIPLKLILTGLLFFTAVFLFAYIAKVIVLGKKDLFDSTVFAYLKSHTTPSVIEWMKGITFFWLRAISPSCLHRGGGPAVFCKAEAAGA